MQVSEHAYYGVILLLWPSFSFLSCPMLVANCGKKDIAGGDIELAWAPIIDSIDNTESIFFH